MTDLPRRTWLPGAGVLLALAMAPAPGRPGGAALAGQPGPHTTDQPIADKFLFAIGAQAATGRFNRPGGIATAPDGTVCVGDMNNHHGRPTPRFRNRLTPFAVTSCFPPPALAWRRPIYPQVWREAAMTKLERNGESHEQTNLAVSKHICGCAELDCDVYSSQRAGA